MRRFFRRFIYLTAFVALIMICGQSSNAAIHLVDFNEPDAERMMLQAINVIRYRENLPLVSLDENLSRSCRRHAMDMALRDYFDHYSPEGVNPDDRARCVGVPNRIQENIGIIRTFGQGLQEVIDALMQGFNESPSHRANLLDPNLTHVGIGFYQDIDGTNHRLTAPNNPDGVYRGFGTVLVVQDFYTRKVALLEPSPYPEYIQRGEFVTIKLGFSDQVDEVFLRISPDSEPNESFDVPMYKDSDGFKARFAIEHEGEFVIGIYANTPSASWYYRQKGSLEITVTPYIF